ncbi:MAG: hypothetical protein VCB42_08015, partial [Myxococcota bacterium]
MLPQFVEIGLGHLAIVADVAALAGVADAVGGRSVWASRVGLRRIGFEGAVVVAVFVAWTAAGRVANDARKIPVVQDAVA